MTETGIIKITDITDSRVAVFASLTETQLQSGNPHCYFETPLFIAESPKVIKVALDSGIIPVALLCEEKHIRGDAKEIIEHCDIPVYTGSRETLSRLTGYKLTRGVLCAMQRPQALPASRICEKSRRIAVIDGVCDTTNIGSIFRAAAALGIDGILLTEGSCDPLNRRAVRVSMGNVFRIPWGWIKNPITELRELGFKTAAMALRQDSVNIDDRTLNSEKKLAIILGTEGDGLADKVIDGADYTVCIPMSNNVDSLNVASAAAIAFWQLTHC